MLPQHGGGCAVAVPPGSVPARQRCPGLSHRVETKPTMPPRARARPHGRRPCRPACCGMQCPTRMHAHRPPGHHRHRGRRRIVRTHARGGSRDQGPPIASASGGVAAARRVRPARQRHGGLDACVRVAPPCGRVAGPLGFSRPPSSSISSALLPVRGGPVTAAAAAGPDGSMQPMQCDCVRACVRARRPDGRTVHRSPGRIYTYSHDMSHR